MDCQQTSKKNTLLLMWISSVNWEHKDIWRGLKGRGNVESGAEKNVELYKNQKKGKTL